MINKLKSMAMSGLRMLTSKKGMLTVIVFGASAVGLTMNPEIASSLAEHLSALLDMLLDAVTSEDAPGIMSDKVAA